MAEPILIYAYEEAEKGVPLSDEDVARGFLEDGWVPVLDFKNYLAALDDDAVDAVDAVDGTLTFFECAWQLWRLPCGTWAIKQSHCTMRKTRMPIDEDEELTTEPTNVMREHTVVVFKSRVDDFISFIAVCDNRLFFRYIGDPSTRPYGMAGTHDIFVVCKQPCVPFVLK